MKIVYKNKFFKIKKNHKNYYIFEPSYRQVCVIPVVDKNKFLIVKVKRPHIDNYFYEFPAGSFSSINEKPLVAAKRELVEETGVILNNKNLFIKLPSIFSMADRLESPMYVYYVHLNNNQIKKLKIDTEEVSLIKIVTYKKIKKLILDGKFNASVPISLLFMYLIKNKIKIT